jgi:tetratricopeptide (TPR) repeat protein
MCLGCQTMLFKRFHGPSVAEVGSTLANELVPATAPNTRQEHGPGAQRSRQIQAFLSRVDSEVRPLALGMFRRARLASSFKWRLLDSGIEPLVAEELTRILLLRLQPSQPAPSRPALPRADNAPPQTSRLDVQTLLARAASAGASNRHAEAAEYYRQALQVKPRDVLACTNLGVALCHLGRYAEAENQFRRATGIKSTYPEAQFNLGTVLRLRGRIAESEMPLRRAVKLSPQHVDAQVSLGLTLVLLGRLPRAVECFERARRLAPRHCAACFGLGQVASLEGRFETAETWFKRAIELDESMPAAWAALSGLRRMTKDDSAWLRRAEKIAASGVTQLEQSDLRFAIGKYWDDLGEYHKAFDSYRRANELQKSAAEPYVRTQRTRFVDDMIGVYSREVISTASAAVPRAEKPVFVTGMMRSGTSLVEQIIASHPHAHGSGELQFWSDAARTHETELRNQPPEESLRKKLSADYLRTLSAHGTNALRVVDKSTFNSDHLGLIQCVLPGARVIYVRRDAVDTCLSCYFHQFSTAHNFTMDLADLAHYYREHRRLMLHWMSALPSGTLLEVPYADLVADQEKWTRRILEFLGLEWNERCLQFHLAQRPVLTASFWQVRQKLYSGAIGRWRNYRKFIGPLHELADLGV